MMIKINSEEKDVLNKLCQELFDGKQDWESMVSYLFKNFYNPKTQRKRLYENIQKLKAQRGYDMSALLALENKGLIERVSENNFIPKPLGVLVFIFGTRISDDDINRLVGQYHNTVEFKLRNVITNFGKSKNLSLSQIAPLVFLLYNNNTSKEKGHFEKNAILKHTIDRIISSFAEANPNSQGTKDRNASLSGHYLTQANNKLGIPIFNEEPEYYIKPNRVKDVEDAIRKTIEKHPQQAKNAFKAFEKCFQKETKILFGYHALYATKLSMQRVKILFDEVCGNEYFTS